MKTINGIKYTPFKERSEIKVGQKVILLECDEMDLSNGYKEGDILEVEDFDVHYPNCVKVKGNRGILFWKDLAPYSEQTKPEEDFEFLEEVYVADIDINNAHKIEGLIYKYLGKTPHNKYIVQRWIDGEFQNVQIFKYCIKAKEEKEEVKPKYNIDDIVELKDGIAKIARVYIEEGDISYRFYEQTNKDYLTTEKDIIGLYNKDEAN